MPAYAYYPGCTLQSTSREYDVSTRLLCQAMGIELRELEDWTCCGASSAHVTSHLLSVSLPARDLHIAEGMGLPLTTPCPACFTRLKGAALDLSDAGLLETVREIIDRDFHNNVEVLTLSEVISRNGASLPLKRYLRGLKVACYYGCLLTRPEAVAEADSVENPQVLDRLMKMVGAEPIDWAFKTECCGASMPFPRPDIVVKLSHKILANAKGNGADCLVVACPMCHANLDMRQGEIEGRYHDGVGMPIIYFTQLLALAAGIPASDLLFDKHFVDPLPLLKEKGLA